MSDTPVTRISYGLGTVLWVAGWVIAKGFWSTFFAVLFPPWGWYLIIQALLIHWGVV